MFAAIPVRFGKMPSDVCDCLRNFVEFFKTAVTFADVSIRLTIFAWLRFFLKFCRFYSENTGVAIVFADVWIRLNIFVWHRFFIKFWGFFAAIVF